MILDGKTVVVSGVGPGLGRPVDLDRQDAERSLQAAGLDAPRR